MMGRFKHFAHHDGRDRGKEQGLAQRTIISPAENGQLILRAYLTPSCRGGSPLLRAQTKLFVVTRLTSTPRRRARASSAFKFAGLNRIFASTC